MTIKIRAGDFNLTQKIMFAIRERFVQTRRKSVATFEHCSDFVKGAAIKIEGISTWQFDFAKKILLFFKRRFSKAHMMLKKELQARHRKNLGRHVKFTHTIQHTLSSFPLRVRV